MQSVRLSIALGPLCSLPLPCRRYGCGSCLGVTHNRRVSDALHRHRIFDTMTMSPDSRTNENHRLVGRSKPRPYSAYFQHNTSQKTPFGRRVAPRCDRAGVWKPIGLSDASSPLLPLTSYLIPSLSSRCKLGELAALG